MFVYVCICICLYLLAARKELIAPTTKITKPVRPPLSSTPGPSRVTAAVGFSFARSLMRQRSLSPNLRLESPARQGREVHEPHMCRIYELCGKSFHRLMNFPALSYRRL
jgi:hypothetical protein